jgi:hypothetical protein
MLFAPYTHYSWYACTKLRNLFLSWIFPTILFVRVYYFTLRGKWRAYNIAFLSIIIPQVQIRVKNTPTLRYVDLSVNDQKSSRCLYWALKETLNKLFAKYAVFLPSLPSFLPTPRRYSSGWALASLISFHFSLFLICSDDEASNGRMKKWEECGWKRSWPTYFRWFSSHSIHLRLVIWYLNSLVFTVWGC